jgi:hypothetical protein
LLNVVKRSIFKIQQGQWKARGNDNGFHIVDDLGDLKMIQRKGDGMIESTSS